MKILTHLRLLKRLPHILPILLLILLAGVAEAIGISALVPLVSTLTNEFIGEDGLPLPFSYLPSIFTSVGLEPTFNRLLVLTLVLISASFLVIHMQERVVATARYNFCEGLRNRATNAILFSTWEHISELSSGEMANKVIFESERASEALMALTTLVATFFQLTVYIILSFLLSWQMSLVTLVTIIVVGVFSRSLINKVRKLGKSSVEANTLYSKIFVDFFRGSKLVKATHLVDTVILKLLDINHLSTTTSKNILINHSIMKLLLQFMIGSVLVLIIYLAVSVLDISLTLLLVFLFIVMRISPKFTTFQGQVHSYFAHRPSLEIVDQTIFKSESMVEDSRKKGKVFKSLEGNITFDQVHYRYPGTADDVLKEICIDIKAKEFTAFVGRSGCGKSTLLDILMGLLEPTSGKLFIDNNEFRALNLESYRTRIGFVPQEATFFDGTIRENLCFASSNEEKLIWDSLAIAQIKDFIESLPEGLNTPIGEAGVKLSGGQRQRLAIARALIRQPVLLILDEATSAMDSQSERNFQKTLEQIADNYTLIVVAHRLSTIKRAHRIYVMEEGRLVEQGNFSDLSIGSGVFSKLVKTQFDLT